MRAPKNPFLLIGYHSPKYFCDRKVEFSWMEEQVLNERNMVFYAHRRMGKTVLIRHFFYHLEKKKQASTLFIDLFGTATIEEVNKKIASAIIQKFGEFKGGIGQRMLNLLSALGATIGLDPLSGTPQVSLSLNSPIATEKSLEVLGEFLMQEKKPIIIAIDEFQQILHYPEKNVEAVFRSWVQALPMIRFIFSGSHRRMMQSMFTDQSRPFYNSAQLYDLQAIDRDEYEAFIQGFFATSSSKMDKVIIQDIFEWTRMQTYYVQLLCNKLYAKQQMVDPELLAEVKHEMVQQEAPVFSSYLELFTDTQWKVLKAIALEEKVQSPQSQEFVKIHNLGAASSVATALKVLLTKGFVVYEQQQYQLHDTLLMRWIQSLQL
jgi:uncharacterized protein